MPAIVILPETSPSKVRDIREEYWAECEKGGLMPPPVPWVQLGKIYLSLFETGEDSWPPIVRELAKAAGDSGAKFTVMSGRHGAPVHNLSKTFQFEHVRDEGHVNEDLQRIAQLKKAFKGLEIDVLDVSQTEYNSPLNLKTEIKKQIVAGRTVILAWCYSIFAMKTASGDMTQIGSPANLAYYANYEKTVETLVREDWASMPRS